MKKSHSKVKIVTDVRDLPLGAQRAASFGTKREADNLRIAVSSGKVRGWKFQLPGDANCRGTIYVMPDEAMEFLRQFHERNDEKVETPVDTPSTDAKLDQIVNCLLRIEDMLEDFLTRPHQKPDDPKQCMLDLAS